EAESPYDDIDLADVPKPPAPDSPINIHGTEPFGKGAQGEEEGEAPGEKSAAEEADRGSPFGDSAGIIVDSQGFLRSQKDSYDRLQGERNQSPIVTRLARIEKSLGFDAEWKESDHPRVSSGPHAGE